MERFEVTATGESELIPWLQILVPAGLLIAFMVVAGKKK
jgi:hypothetical protein